MEFVEQEKRRVIYDFGILRLALMVSFPPDVGLFHATGLCEGSYTGR